MARRFAVLDAPSNLGLRPPAEGVVPGVYKLAGALRDTGLVTALDARDAGVVVPPRYYPDWDRKSVRNGPAIARYSARLADRVGALVDARHVCVIGVRAGDSYLAEVRELGMLVYTAPQVRKLGAAAIAEAALEFMEDLPIEGVWIHLDVDVIDKSVLPAVDSPTRGGLAIAELTQLLLSLTGSSGTAGIEVTIFDPDLDESGALASTVSSLLIAGLGR